jgi:hypothetical protein
MRKLDPVIYNKLLLQADEARELGMVKLADAIVDAIGTEAGLKKTEYSYSELQEDIHKDLWKVVTKLAIYHDINSIDALKVNAAVTYWATKMIDAIEEGMGVYGSIKGPLEPKLPGESK